MKRCIAFVTAIACGLSSLSYADEIGPRAEYIEAAVVPVPEEADAGVDASQQPKSVGKAAADGTNTAKNSNAGKYLLAAGAIAVGIAALVLVSRNSGHHKGSNSHSH